MKLLALLLVSFVPLTAAQAIPLNSPDGRVHAEFSLNRAGDLSYTVSFDARTVVEPSRIGIAVAGTDFGAGVALDAPEYRSLDESYPVTGTEATAYNRANLLRLPLTHRPSGNVLVLEARAYNDGVAWRLIVPGVGRRRVLGEATTWTLPAGSRVWFAERNSDWKLKTYAGAWISAEVDALPTISEQGPVQGPPLVFELPDRGGYALLTEAALANYSGMRLRATGSRRLQADFTEGEAGFTVDGTITTPWRVTLLARTLEALVNSHLIGNLNPAPDPRLFADTSYIKPGRCVFRWWSLGTGTAAEEKQFVDYAAQLGFEYSLVDDGWAKWPAAWDQVASLATYAKGRGIGLIIWSDVKELRDPANDWSMLRTFLDQARDAGVAAVKLDFINSESRESIDFQQAALRLAALRRLMVVFHGVQKPTGESRTYPNEITREGIRGLELNNSKTQPAIPGSHNAALPYTRLAIGPGDYVPLGYSRPGPTTWAHQLATVIQLTSPLQVISENPEMLLHDPAVRPALDVLKAVPSVWDETRVLEPSRIGELSVMARRKGRDWFLAVLTGDQGASLKHIDLSFLGAGSYRLVRIDGPSARELSRSESKDVSRETRLNAELAPADGLVCWFVSTSGRP